MWTGIVANERRTRFVGIFFFLGVGVAKREWKCNILLADLNCGIWSTGLLWTDFVVTCFWVSFSLQIWFSGLFIWVDSTEDIITFVFVGVNQCHFLKVIVGLVRYICNKFSCLIGLWFWCLFIYYRYWGQEWILKIHLLQSCFFLTGKGLYSMPER